MRPHLLAGSAYLQLDEPENATACFLHALDLDPGNRKAQVQSFGLASVPGVLSNLS